MLAVAAVPTYAKTVSYAVTGSTIHEHFALRHREPIQPLQMRFFNKTITLQLRQHHELFTDMHPDHKHDVDQTRFLRGHVVGQEHTSWVMLYLHGNGKQQRLEGDIELREQDGSLGQYRLEAVHDDDTEQWTGDVAVIRPADVIYSAQDLSKLDCHHHDVGHVKRDSSHVPYPGAEVLEEQRAFLLGRRQVNSNNNNNGRKLKVARIGFTYEPAAMKAVGQAGNMTAFLIQLVGKISKSFEEAHGVKLAVGPVVAVHDQLWKSNGGECLKAFEHHVASDKLGYDRTSVALHHFLTRDDASGMAYISQLCNHKIGIAWEGLHEIASLREAIMAHELGHNFGALHDPETNVRVHHPRLYLCGEA